MEKAAPALSVPVGGNVSYVLGLDAVELGDYGMSSGDVGRYMSVVDVSVSCGDDIELCGVGKMLSGAVSGDLCDLDRVPGGGDTGVSGVDTVVSAAVNGCLCDLDIVSRGVIVVSLDDMSLSGRGGAMMLGVDESMCGVNSMLAAGVLDLCCCDTLVSCVDEPVCGVRLVMTASEHDVCCRDSVVSERLVTRVVLRWLCPLMTRFVLVAGCRWLVKP